MNSVTLNNISHYAIPGLKNNARIPINRTPEKIIAIICEYCGQPVDKVLGLSQKQKFIVPRYTIILFLWLYTNMNKSAIGRRIGRDHTTVINALNTFPDRIEKEDSIKKMVADLKQKIL